MVIQKSNLKTLYLYKRSQLKFILFTVIIGSIFYYNQTFALDEIDNKSSLNSSSLQIPSENNKTLESELVFSNVTNITNNPTDSVYAQIVANDNNVYMIWQESVIQNSNEKNYDIFFKKSCY